jgi:hypothetical protein
MKLGRLPHNPAAIAAAPAHRFGVIPPPTTLDRSAISFTPGLYDNNSLPDCSAAGLANAAMAIAALNGYELLIEADKVPIFYSLCVNSAPTPAAMEATDGAVLLDVLARQAVQGFDIGPQTLYGRYGTVQLTRTALALSLARLGVGYWGVTLHDRDMQTFGDRWDVMPGRDDGAVVGGHCVVAWDFTGLGDGDTVRVGTWGRWQVATWNWVHARLDEAHALVFRQLARADGFYNGVTADGLVAEL